MRSARIAIAAAALAACATVPAAPRSALMKATGGSVAVNARELRAGDDALAARVPGKIETAADAIIARSNDPAIRHRALAWKVEVVPAFYQALFGSDPLVALIDVWALSIQLETYLERGPARNAFGDLQPVAAEAARGIVSDIEWQAAAMTTPEAFARGKAKIVEWARSNPIEGPLSSRPSVLPLLAQMSGASDSGLFEAVGEVTASIADLSTRLDIYAAYLPKAGRWQAELAIGELGGPEAIRQALANLGSLGAAGDRAASLLSDEGIRHAASMGAESVRAESAALLASIDRQRLDTLERVGRERVAAFAEIAAERVAVTKEIDRQRLLAAEQFDELRRRSMSDLDALATRILLRAALALVGMLLVGAALYFSISKTTKAPRGRAAPAP